MTSEAQTELASTRATTREFLGHPRGLTILFATEMWERFSYFGNGALKPNISTQVGALYALGDHRRARAYTIFYVGINIGAFLAPLVCGALAAAWGWHFGFTAAGIGMLISLGIYLAGTRMLPPDEFTRSRGAAAPRQPLRPE